MDKILVKVCMGTGCFIKNSAIVQQLNDIIPKNYKDSVEMEPIQCLGLCSIKWEDSKAPYVKVDDDVIEEATVKKVLQCIDKKLAK